MPRAVTRHSWGSTRAPGWPGAAGEVLGGAEATGVAHTQQAARAMGPGTAGRRRPGGVTGCKPRRRLRRQCAVRRPDCRQRVPRPSRPLPGVRSVPTQRPTPEQLSHSRQEPGKPASVDRRWSHARPHGRRPRGGERPQRTHAPPPGRRGPRRTVPFYRKEAKPANGACPGGKRQGRGGTGA